MRRLAALTTGDVIDAPAVLEGLGTASEASPMARATAGLAASVEAHLDDYFAVFGDDLPPDGLYDRVLAEIERPLLTLALAATRGNQIRAARLLGINRNTLRKKLNDHSLDALAVRRV